MPRPSKEADPFSLAYEDMSRQVRSIRMASSPNMDERALRRQLSDIEGAREDLAMLNATVDIVNANRERYPDLSEREIMDRQYKVDRLTEDVYSLRATVDAKLKLAHTVPQNIELQQFKICSGSTDSRFTPRSENTWFNISAREALLDDKLDTLDDAIDRLSVQAHTINAAVIDMRPDVDGLTGEMDFSHERLGAVQKRVARLLKTNSKSEIKTIIILTIIFFILLILLII